MSICRGKEDELWARARVWVRVRCDDVHDEGRSSKGLTRVTVRNDNDGRRKEMTIVAADEEIRVQVIEGRG
jgi:hypothetical protein